MAAWRRAIASVVVVALFLGTSVTAAPAAVVEPLDYANACEGASSPPNGFVDAGLAADCLKVYGVSLGKSDGTFGEDDLLLRSQVSSLVVRLLQLAGVAFGSTKAFLDVNATTVPDEQVRREIGLLAGSGIIVGFTDGRFHPADLLTVSQATTLVVRALALIHSRNANAPAYVDQGSTAADYDYAVQNQLLLAGTVDAHGALYASDRSATSNRGLFAEVIVQGLQALVDAGLVHPIGLGHADDELSAGVVVSTLHVDGPNVVNLVAIDRAQGLEIRSTLATGMLTGRLPTSEISRRWHATVAVNGDFFLSNGEPAHPFATGGRLLKAPANIEDSTGFSSTDPREAHFGTPNPLMWAEVQETGEAVVVNRFNDGAPSSDELAIDTREGATATSPPADACYARMVPTAPPAIDANGAATQLHVVTAMACEAAPTTIGDDDLLIAPAGGSHAPFVTALVPGQHVIVGWTLHPDWPDLLDSTGSNTTLVHNGAPSDDVVNGDGPFYEAVAPRTAVGQLADGRDVLVVVDGRQPGYSVGMTPLQLAEFLVSIGVVEATNLDGGGSSSLVINGRLVNRPSDAAGERPVGTALVVVAAGTPEPPRSADVEAAPPPSPNDAASLGGYAATLQMHGVALSPELEAAANAFTRADR